MFCNKGSRSLSLRLIDRYLILRSVAFHLVIRLNPLVLGRAGVGEPIPLVVASIDQDDFISGVVESHLLPVA